MQTKLKNKKKKSRKREHLPKAASGIPMDYCLRKTKNAY